LLVASVLTADFVVGAHDLRARRLPDAGLERRQVDLAQWSLVHLHVDGAAVVSWLLTA